MLSCSRKYALVLWSAAACLMFPTPGRGQNTPNDLPPVIDVHVHSMTESFPGGGPMCPNEAKFLASDPATKEAPFGWDV